MRNTLTMYKIHDLSDVQTNKIGSGTSIWQYAVILEGACIGANCNINCHTFIENDVELGNNVTVKSGVYIWDGVKIHNNVFLGPGVVFTNDLRPRSKKRVRFKKTIVGEFASIGANSTILAGVEIGKYAMSGIGSVITKDVPSHALVFGNPAKIQGWLDKDGNKLIQVTETELKSISGDMFRVIDSQLIKI